MNSAIPTQLKAIVYSDSSVHFVNTYNLKAVTDKSGDNWNADDPLLTELKKEIKTHYLQTQNHTCAYCRQKIVVDHNGAWDTDHIISKDTHPAFMFVPENLCLSCKDCNGTKSNRKVLTNNKRKKFPSESKDYLICHPHFDDYDEHIKVIGHAVLYLPKTKKGQTLIEMCGLLRFVYDFAGYEITDSNLADKVVSLGTAMQNAQSDYEKIAITQMLRTMLDEGLRVAALKQLQSYGMS